MQRPLSAISLLVLIGIGEIACHHKKQAVTPDPFNLPAAVVPEKTPTTPEIENPPEINPPNTKAPQTLPPTEVYQNNRPPRPPPSSRRQSPPRNTAPTTGDPRSATPASPPPTPEPPQLGSMLTPDQQRQFNTDIDQCLQRAQTSLNAIKNRQLNKEQQDRLGQVRTFIQQAQTVRASDLPGAKSLAERAEVLARDLAASLQ